MEIFLPQSAYLTIGELARRTGMSVSAIRFYESRGLVRAARTSGNQRRFMRSDIRRLSFALIAQQLGLTLGEIEAELSLLPQGRAPNRQDWHLPNQEKECPNHTSMNAILMQ